MKSKTSCICCNELCGDAERKKYYDRFSGFASQREAEWKALSSTPPLPPGQLNFMGFPREIRDAIYKLLLELKDGDERTGTHDHFFPSQILYLNKQIRDEFLDELLGSSWTTCLYATWEGHFQVELPPPTLFPRVKWLQARFLITDPHVPSIPSWTQVLHDAELWLMMFPNLVGATFSFRSIHREEKTVIETDFREAWNDCGLLRCEQAKKVDFNVWGPKREGFGDPNIIVQTRKRLICLRRVDLTSRPFWREIYSNDTKLQHADWCGSYN